MIHNKSGQGLIEAIVAAGIAGTAIYVLAQLSNVISQESAKASRLPTMLAIESSLDLAMENKANFTDLTPSTYSTLKLFGTDRVLYGDTAQPLYFNSDGSTCRIPGGMCGIRSEIKVHENPAGSGQFSVGYRISDVSGVGGQYRALGADNLNDPNQATWVYPVEFTAQTGNANCNSTSLLLRGYDPVTGVPICWNQGSICNDGQIAYGLSFNNTSNTYRTLCKTLRAAKCADPGYGVLDFKPRTLDPRTPAAVGTCVFLYEEFFDKPTSGPYAGRCPVDYYVSSGTQCVLDAAHGPKAIIPNPEPPDS
jgi:hypothetical protein